MISRRTFLRYATIFGLPAMDIKRFIPEMVSVFAETEFNPDFSICVVSPDELLDLEFSFVNLKRNGNAVESINLAKDSFLLIRVPKLHIAEQTWSYLDSIATESRAKSYIGGDSFLVFKFRKPQISNFYLHSKHLLDWGSGGFFELVVLNDTNYTRATVRYGKMRYYSGLGLIDGSPVTSLEFNYGLTISPINRQAGANKTMLGFSKKLTSEDYLYPPEKFLAIPYTKYHLKALERTPEPERSVVTNAGQLSPIQYQSYWYSEMIGQSASYRNQPAEFKVIGFDATTRDDSRLLPTYSDKRTLFEQFTHKFPSKDIFSDEQLLKSYDQPLRISALGLSASLEYTSPDGLALLQKLKQVLQNSRDSYVEVQRLGFMYPLGIRIVEITIGRRRYKNGTYFIERKKYVAPLERKIIYRQVGEASMANADNVLQRTVEDGPWSNDFNYIKSTKRSFPFQQIEVLNEEFIQIQDQEGKLNQACQQEFARIYQALSPSVKNYLEKAVDLLKMVNQKELLLRRDAVLEKLVGNEIFQLANDSADTGFKENRFTDVVGIFASLVSFSKAATKPFADQSLQDTFLALQASITEDLSGAIDLVKDQIGFACELAMLELNKLDENIASIKSEGIDRLNAFWPIDLDGNPVTFSLRAKDWDDQQVHFQSAFLLVKGEAVVNLNKAYEQSVNFLSKKINTELLLIQQELRELRNRSLQYINLGVSKLKSITEALKLNIEGMELAAYNRYEELKRTTQAKHGKLILAVNSLDERLPAELEAKRDELQKEIDQLEGTVREKFNHLLNLKVLLLVNRSLLAGNYHPVENTLKKALGHMEGKIKNLEENLGDQLDDKLKERWYKLNHQIYGLDESLTRNYHHQKHLLRRQINIPSVKIAYYKSRIADAVGQIDDQVNQLRTELIEFAAIPIAKIADFRYQAKQQQDELAKKVNEFGKRFSFTYPQLLSARVRLPVVGDLDTEVTALMNEVAAKLEDKKNAVIAYADAYRLAGVEGWKTGELAAKRNAEQILLEIKSLLPQVAQFDNTYKTEVVDKWNQLRAKQAEFESRTIGYAKSSYQAVLSGIEDRIAGLVQPALEVRQISLLKDKALVLYNQVDRYKGEVESFIKDGKGTLQNGVATFKDFEKNINSFVIKQANYFKELFQNIQVFGLDAGKEIGRDLQMQLDKVPQAKVELLKNSNGIPIGSSVRYNWKKTDNTPLFEDGKGIVRFINGTGPKSTDKVKLEIQISNLTFWDGVRNNSFETRIEIKDFGIGAAGIIEVYFSSVSMVKSITQVKNSKDEWQTNTVTRLKVNLLKVEFTGFLELIKKLQDALGLGDGFLIDINTSGITLSYGVRIPAISTGAFTISNISLYAGLSLSFTGRSPAVRFAFAERESPFTLAAGIFGGRGFLAMEVSKIGVEKIEGALEYGGFLALNITGIAKGQAYLMVGIYFRQTSSEALFVEAYVTCGGSLSIIGLIQVSVVFHLGMSYQNGALTGRASVRVSISMLFFSASYTLQYEKRITGDSAALKKRHLEEQDTYYADATVDREDRLAFLDALFAADVTEKPYAYLLTEQILGEFDTLLRDRTALNARLEPVYDPTLILELAMDFDKYIEQFETQSYE